MVINIDDKYLKRSENKKGKEKIVKLPDGLEKFKFRRMDPNAAIYHGEKGGKTVK
jgi:hypothetical protein